MEGFGLKCLGVLALSSLLASWSGCGGGDDADGLPEGVAAQVGDTVIREVAVAARLRQVYAARDGSSQAFGPPAYPACAKQKRVLDPSYTRKDIQRICKYEYENTRAEALSTLVRSEHLRREARRRGFDPDRVFARAVVKLKALARLQGHGSLPPGYPDVEAKNSILRERLLAAMPLTETEIRDHATANPEVFLKPERRRAHILQFKAKQPAFEARRRLESHASWAEVQSRYALEPSPGRWTGTFTADEFSVPADAFGRGIFTAKPRQLIGPVHTLNGWFVFEVLDVRPPPQGGITARARTHIAAYMRLQKLERALYDHYDKITKCLPQYETSSTPCIITPAGLDH